MLITKNNLFIYSFLALCILMTISCKKTFSDDSPLPKTFVPMALVPTTNGTMYALDAASGFKVWEFKTASASASITNTPLVAFDSIAFFGDNSKNFYAVNIKTGKTIWMKNFGNTVINHPYFFNNKVYITINNPGAAKDSILQIDQTGNITWRNNVSGDYAAAPIIFGNRLYIGVNDGKLYCYDINAASNAAPIWSFNALGSVNTNPSYVSGFLYFANDQRKVFKVDANTGSQVWSFLAGDKVNSSPIVYGDMVVVGCEDFKIYCIDATSGKTVSRWIYPTADRIKASACLDKASENMIIGSNDFNLYAIHHVTGNLSWKFPTSSIINTSPVSYNGNIIVSSLDKYCYCINASNGKLVWKYNLNSTTQGSPMVCTVAGTNYYPAICGNSDY
jgi:eukaryotic-like serine/threonine-protein kinase